MKFRRDLVIVALATFCLTSTLFMVVTSRSADSPNWDPWADIREDGTVDIYDAITLANAFGSSGETPKNVNVVEIHNATWTPYWQTIEVVENLPMSVDPTTHVLWMNLGTFNAAGYSRMTLYASVANQTSDAYGQLNLWLNTTYDLGPTNNGIELHAFFAWNAFVNVPTGQPIVFDSLAQIETIAPTYTVTLQFCHNGGVSNASCLFSLGVYLRNE